MDQKKIGFQITKGVNNVVRLDFLQKSECSKSCKDFPLKNNERVFDILSYLFDAPNVSEPIAGLIKKVIFNTNSMVI